MGSKCQEKGHVSYRQKLKKGKTEVEELFREQSE